ncbi:Major facilitator superfamily [Alloactinosynnema sp. L-07]|nr:Major facilitator superfamily [Alloactinosynnema sp. L-07]
MIERGLSRRVLLLLAMACGVAVGNVYFPQAVSPLVASGLGVSPDSATLVVTGTQLGYSLGIFLLVPLGDRLPHRPLIVSLVAVTALSLLAAGFAPGLPPLVGASVLIGVTTVIAPVIGPMAAGLVAADRRGEVSGTLLAGSIGGMLLARTFAGTAGDWIGWRAPYLIAGAVTAVLAVMLAFVVPKSVPATRQRYLSLIIEPLRLLRTEPDLRRSCFYQATIFGGFSAVWTTVALLLTGPTYGYGAEAVGWLALIGAATMICTPIAGRQVDRRGSDPINLVCMIAVIGSAVLLIPGGFGGVVGLGALVLGTLVLDVAMQSGMVANLVRVYAIRPDARGRLNTAYMTCAYLGGTVGSWAGTRAYTAFGWLGVCALVGLLGVIALTAGPHARVIRKAGWSGATRRRSVSAEEASTPSKNIPTSNFHRLR